MEIGFAECGRSDEAFERRKRRADTRLKLALLKHYDQIVESYNQLSAREDLSPAEIDSWRERRRSEYRRATGVEIEQRDALKLSLQRSVEIGDRSVDEVIDELRQGYSKGLSLVESGSGRACERF
jgi:hypothetical protein